jgi:hypothetical protein
VSVRFTRASDLLRESGHTTAVDIEVSDVLETSTGGRIRAVRTSPDRVLLTDLIGMGGNNATVVIEAPPDVIALEGFLGNAWGWLKDNIIDPLIEGATRDGGGGTTISGNCNNVDVDITVNVQGDAKFDKIDVDITCK